MKKLIVAVALLLALPSVAMADTAGAVLGAFVGGALGSQVGGGNARLFTGIIGAAAGANIGTRLEDGTYFNKKDPVTHSCAPGFRPAWVVDPSRSDTRVCLVKEEHEQTFNNWACPASNPRHALMVAGNQAVCLAEGSIVEASTVRAEHGFGQGQQQQVTYQNNSTVGAALRGRADRMADEQKQAELVAYCVENPSASKCSRFRQYTGGGLFGGAARFVSFQ